MTPFEHAKAQKAILERNVAKASAKLKAVPGLASGPMRLTPDNVKATDAYQQANAEYDHAFKRLRAFNGPFVRIYRKELRAERRGPILNKA